MKALFDTNILIDFLKRFPAAATDVDAWDDKAISLITWIEIMAGVADIEEEVRAVEEFLDKLTLLQIDSSVAAETVLVRKARKLKLPDAIIKATAHLTDRVLVTRNLKDFRSGWDVRVPYGNPSALPPQVWQMARVKGVLPRVGASDAELNLFEEYLRQVANKLVRH